MRVKSEQPVQFLGAELKPWEMNGKTGESWSIAVLSGLDSSRFGAPGPRFTASAFPKAGTSVHLVLELFLGKGGGRPKVAEIHPA